MIQRDLTKEICQWKSFRRKKNVYRGFRDALEIGI